MPTHTGYKHRLLADAPWLSEGQAKRLAKRLMWRAEHMQEQFDWYAELKVLGIHDDNTAREAVGA